MNKLTNLEESHRCCVHCYLFHQYQTCYYLSKSAWQSNQLVSSSQQTKYGAQKHNIPPILSTLGLPVSSWSQPRYPGRLLLSMGLKHSLISQCWSETAVVSSKETFSSPYRCRIGFIRDMNGTQFWPIKSQLNSSLHAHGYNHWPNVTQKLKRVKDLRGRNTGNNGGNAKTTKHGISPELLYSQLKAIWLPAWQFPSQSRGLKARGILENGTLLHMLRTAKT